MRMFGFGHLHRIKVERLEAGSSAAPTRVKYGRWGRFPRFAPNKLIWANRAINALPHRCAAARILGPVMIGIRRCGGRLSGLAINGSFSTCSTTGWRPSVIRIPGFIGKCRARCNSASGRVRRVNQHISSASALALCCKSAECGNSRSNNSSYSCFPAPALCLSRSELYLRTL